MCHMLGKQLCIRRICDPKHIELNVAAAVEYGHTGALNDFTR